MKPILEVRALNKVFRWGSSALTAMNDISFDLYRGKTYGLVGESGSGKTTTGRSLLNLNRPDSGSVLYNGVDLSKLSDKQWRPYRKKLQMIYQDPNASLNPRKTIGKILEEPLLIHKMGTPKERSLKIATILGAVGLTPEHAHRYPHQLSGGQRQRLGIARALIMEPEIIVCDEPVSALDVSIQAQILNLLVDLQQARNLTLLFISHDMSVVRHISDRVGVMYKGTLVEEADTLELFDNPIHPYTRQLLLSIPGHHQLPVAKDPDAGHLVSELFWEDFA